ncbi:hypothetical protein [Sphingomonas paucimobilis]|uniref:hypothetical protein n=1 Tax=Sphingomonas paucimobilis TaxID=13689 RepID=UPI0028D89D99|nr:hypothetical protein [Sphingomonas paucimobilis]
MKPLLILALSFASIATPAVAQRQMEADTGSLAPVPRRARISDAPSVSEKDRGRITMAQFVRCTVDRKPTNVARITSLPADKLGGVEFAKAADEDCLLAGEIRFKPILMRGALFVELYRRRQAAEQRHIEWRLPVVPFDVQTPVDPTNEELATQMALLAFAKCVIDRDPATARAVVMGPTVSKVQDTAINALVPNLGPCLPNGQKITLSRNILEGALGEVLYRGTVPSVRPASQEAK